jgi:hypothetical protein
MTRTALVLACLLAAVPHRASAQSTAKDSVIATVNEFFRAMTAHDSAAAKRVMTSDGIFYAVRVRGDSTIINRSTNESFAQTIATTRDTYLERMWEPTVMVHGPIAVLWTPYDFHRSGQFSHCGIDAFSLVRSAAGWKNATITYTVEPTNCAPSPLGAPK